jgi:hypothetical protein
MKDFGNIKEFSLPATGEGFCVVVLDYFVSGGNCDKEKNIFDNFP